jgi:hypothetical protein
MVNINTPHPPVFRMCGNQRTLSPLDLELWQMRGLRADFSDVWQGRNLDAFFSQF